MLAGCFSTSGNNSKELRLAGENVLANKNSEAIELTKNIQPPLWQLWAPGKTINGEKLTDHFVLKGDEAFKVGQFNEAAASYDKSSRIADLAGDITLRKSAALLSANKPKEALISLGQFLNANKISSEQVSVPFAIMLGYAYSKSGDVDQSLAWFSHAGNIRNLNNPFESTIRQGVNDIIQYLPEDRFNDQSIVWRDDVYVSKLIAEERYRRTQPGGMVKVRTESFSQELSQSFANLSQMPVAAGARRIVALLPLTGSFAKLGDSTKKGVALALSDSSNNGTSIEYIDVGNDVVNAMSAVKNILSTNPPQVFIGPLISDIASQISDQVRGTGIPIITLAKSEQLITGAGVYRFGVSQSDQMYSLVKKTLSSYPISRFGILSPSDNSGRDVALAFKSEVERQGGTVVFSQEYDRNDSLQLGSVGVQVPIQNIQALFVADRPSNAGRIFASLSPELRDNLIPMGPATWANANEFKNSATVLNRSIFVAPFFEGDPRPFVKNFIDGYRVMYGKSPDLLAAQGFDAATLALAALKQEYSSGSDFDGALRAISMYDGITGKIAINGEGQIERDYPVMQFKDGSFNPVGEEKTFLTPGLQ